MLQFAYFCYSVNYCYNHVNRLFQIKKPQNLGLFYLYLNRTCNEKLHYGINTALKLDGFSMSATYRIGGTTLLPEPKPGTTL